MPGQGRKSEFAADLPEVAVLEYRGMMSTSDQTASTSITTPAGAARIIAAIEAINQVDIENAPEADRAAVLELIDLTTDEQRASLLFALLLDRIRTSD